MGKEISAAFIWKLAWKQTLSPLGTEAKTKFSEPNTPFNQPLKPRRREGRKGRAEGQRGSPFIWTWFRRSPTKERSKALFRTELKCDQVLRLERPSSGKIKAPVLIQASK